MINKCSRLQINILSLSPGINGHGERVVRPVQKYYQNHFDPDMRNKIKHILDEGNK